MAFTLQQLNTLDAQLASNVQSVKYGDKEVQYATFKDGMQLRALMAEELGLTSRKSQRKVQVFNKGVNDCKYGK